MPYADERSEGKEGMRLTMNIKKKKNEFNYFEQFEKSVRLAKEEIEELKKYINNFKNIDSETEMKKIHELENQGDNNLHELKNYLLKDFLPPIDREDILSMSYEIDDLIDAIDEVAIDMNIYNITEVTEDLKILIDLLEKTILSVYELIVELANLKKIKEIKDKIIEVNQLEEQADKLYQKAIKELYSKEKDQLNIMKWTSIYQRVEDCFDACETIAYASEEILLKNT